MSQEKRKHVRNNISEFVKLTSINGIWDGEVTDISVQGISILVDQNIDLHELCTIDVQYLADSSNYKVRCLIVNKTPLLIKKKLRLGLEFKWESSSQRDEIQQKITEFLT